MDADEIGLFYHGDRIRAMRDSAHPSWLELVDGPGWVKEYHEGDAVWKAILFESDGGTSPCRRSDASPVDETPSTPLDDTPSTKKCFDVSESMTSCSGSSSNSAVDRQLLRELRPASFAGLGRKLGDGGHNLGDSGTFWFTGKSYRIPELQSEALSTEKKTRPKWADMVDSDPDDSDTVLDFNSLGDTNLEKGFEISSNSELVRKPKRKKRNQDLLRRKSKTQLCRYLQEKGMCPFGDACWFAHGVVDIERLDLENRSFEKYALATHEVKFQDDTLDLAENIA